MDQFDGGAVGADWVPQKFRAYVYRVLTTAAAVEGIFDFLSPDVEVKVAKILAIFGFGLAWAYTPRKS